ncbi:hypothetical protein BDQ12DRAFT_364699 [Crucibulum laeve]|uniref:Uncharacterized protein n=1 Tax=Crucibulum laeve TaxID=68775 RepID=A0A5C3LNS8_9AGAR|nr:hypothetical protein BDQ12DRAFT_364699 [Crucibulum laeve]
MSDYYSKDTSDSRARRHERRRTSPERSRVDLSREQPRDQIRDQSRRHSPAERKPRTPSPEHTRRNPYVVHEDFSLTAVSPIPRMSFAPTVVAYPVSDDEGDSRPNRDDRRRRARTRSPGYTTSPRRHQSQRHEYRPRDRIEGESTDRRERRDRPPISGPPPASTPSKVGSQPSVEDRSRFAEMFSPIKNGEQPLPTIRPLVL